jgi:hypothetical protein
MKILRLCSYEIFLGMDYLRVTTMGRCGSTGKRKTICFKYDGARITLMGFQSSIESCIIVSIVTLQDLVQSGEVFQLMELFPMDWTNAFEETPVPHVVEEISRQHSMFFLPTEKMTAIYRKPINMKTYHYALHEKTEINDLQGPYWREYEPFASPVLLMDFFLVLIASQEFSISSPNHKG